MSEAAGGFAILSRSDLEALSRAAREAPRLRLNRNLHEMDDAVHRLLNAMEPGSYVRPHRHAHPPKDETLVCVAGRLGLLVFDAKGAEIGKRALSPGGPDFGAALAAGCWHTLVALAEGTVFFETKPGPYVKPIERDLAAWSPEEGSTESKELEISWRNSFR